MARNSRKKKLTRDQKRTINPLKKPSQTSRYGRKRRFLDEHGGSGKDYPSKPWR